MAKIEGDEVVVDSYRAIAGRARAHAIDLLDAGVCDAETVHEWVAVAAEADLAARDELYGDTGPGGE